MQRLDAAGALGEQELLEDGDGGEEVVLVGADVRELDEFGDEEVPDLEQIRVELLLGRLVGRAI